MALILFQKASSNIHENSWRHFCSLGEGFASENVARFFDIYESELRKVQSTQDIQCWWNMDYICATQAQQIFQLEEQEKSGLSNIGSVVARMNATGTPLIMFPRKIWMSNLWIEHRWARLWLAIQMVGFRRIYLLNGSIILLTSLSLRQMILLCWLLVVMIKTPKIQMWRIKPGNTVLPLSVSHHILSTKFSHLVLVSWSHQNI